MYPFYRRIKHIGRVRAFYAAKSDRRNWDEEYYPAPPEMRYLGMILPDGAWADLKPSRIKVDRYSRVRGEEIDSHVSGIEIVNERKVTRLNKRRKIRKYQAYQR
jgi:hypothetical protein